jgi:hypothetical protein
MMKNFKKIEGKVYGRIVVEKSICYPYKGKTRKIECTCGYIGVAVNNSCKKCGQEAFIKLKSKINKNTELLNLKKEGHLISATLIARSVFKNNGTMYLRDAREYFVSHNTLTGETYLNSENISFKERVVEDENDIWDGRHIALRGIPNFMLFDEVNYHPPFLEDERLQDELEFHNQGKALLPFFKICAKERDLNYIDVGQILNNKNGVDYMITLLRFPILQNLPFTGFKKIPEGLASRIDEIKHPKEIWLKLIGHKSERVKKIATKSVRHFNHLMRWGKLIEKPENLMNLAESFKFNTNSDLYMIRAGRDKTVQEENELFSTFYDSEVKNFEKGVKLLFSLHEDETVWINRILSFKKDRTEDRVFSYISDIGNMYELIKDQIPEFEVTRTKSVETVHDELSSWMKKIKTMNRKIKYTEKELELEAEPFFLAKDTHELVDVGENLRICVGSYADRAVSKLCTIVLLKEEDTVKVCIELRNKEIVQAKMAYNKMPTEVYAEMIGEWAENHQLDIKTFDLPNKMQIRRNSTEDYYHLLRGTANV